MFSIIDLSNITHDVVELTNASYEMWNKTYTEILAEAKEELKPEYFFKSKLLLVMHEANEVQALMLVNTLFTEVNGTLDLAYFDPVSPHIKEMFKNKRSSIMSLEWVTVAPELRARFAKVQFVDVMMGLGFKVAADSTCDSCMGFSRMDQQADRSAGKFGIKNISVVKRHDIDCAVMFTHVDELNEHPYKKTAERVNELYENKINYSTIVKDKKRKAA